MGESRTELLAWLNDILQLKYTKIEQAGTGAAYCQVFDSIYGDIHLSKVKFDAKHDYEYINNFKILQASFKKHKIDKIIPVDRLIKCKLQDNLEFMQWVKPFWEMNFPGGEYDAVGRRKGVPTSNRSSTTTNGRVSSAAGHKRATKTPGSRSASQGGRTSVLDNTNSSMIIDLNKQIAELKMTVDGLEKERDFYFGKLREIEIEVQEYVDNTNTTHSPDSLHIVKGIQTILYSTEDGFEVPPEEEVEKIEEFDDNETF